MLKVDHDAHLRTRRCLPSSVDCSQFICRQENSSGAILSFRVANRCDTVAIHKRKQLSPFPASIASSLIRWARLRARHGEKMLLLSLNPRSTRGGGETPTRGRCFDPFDSPLASWVERRVDQDVQEVGNIRLSYSYVEDTMADSDRGKSHNRV